MLDFNAVEDKELTEKQGRYIRWLEDLIVNECYVENICDARCPKPVEDDNCKFSKSCLRDMFVQDMLVEQKSLANEITKSLSAAEYVSTMTDEIEESKKIYGL